MFSNTIDTNTVDYYIDYLIILAIIYIMTLMLVSFLNNKNEQINSQNASLDVYAMQNEHLQIIHNQLTSDQKSLRWRFLLVSTAIKACTWIKEPYTYALYNRVHGFSRTEIGVLVAIENMTSLIVGPIIGSLCDLYGRKKFCVFYCLCVISHICLRVTGIRILAYPANIIAGICSVLLDTAFESWVIFQANELFDDSVIGERAKNSFLRQLFTKQVNLDCLSSIVLTAIVTYLYFKYNILYPFYTCIVFVVIACVNICILWVENNVAAYVNKQSNKQTLCER